MPSQNVKYFIAGALLLSMSFFGYNYFNNKGSVQDNIKRNSKRVEDSISATSNKREVISKETTADAQSLQNQNQKWVANDYKLGDLKVDDGKYTVSKGDTLWEISEAVYGDGSEWTTLLSANSSSIGFLPDGSQALIQVGQVLIIP